MRLVPPKRIPLYALCIGLILGFIILSQQKFPIIPKHPRIQLTHSADHCIHQLMRHMHALQKDHVQRNAWSRDLTLAKQLYAIRNPASHGGLRRQTCIDLCAALATQNDSQVKPQGGGWAPNGGEPCEKQSKSGTVIIIPLPKNFRPIDDLVTILTRILRLQNTCHKIFLVEQQVNTTASYNMGMLMNIGFVEAGLRFEADCFVFHDPRFRPDISIEHDRLVSHKCGQDTNNGPVHMATMINRMVNPSRSLTGVLRIRAINFIRANGFSNWFLNVPGVFDDFERRILLTDQEYRHEDFRFARYATNENTELNEELSNNVLSWTLIDHAGYRMNVDGLRQISYRLEAVLKEESFTRIVVRLLEDPHLYCETNTD
ncbi:hypothetical protein D915_001563 [Fasciola hepatica]|uniref:Beta-1,4-galactosyltransferase n=1 Tax=Fasciola hepatica TaxID=6192 RepID=A0A2H1CRS1_FASHE|nr:hypothetical protein D915_001563 [Fasciola hepatica]